MARKIDGYTVRQIVSTLLAFVFGIACFACAALADKGDYAAMRACITSGAAFCFAVIGAVIE